MSIQAGQELLLNIEKPVLGGHGLGRVDGMAVFVQGALPGQRIRARITACKPRHARAELLDVLIQSPDFTPPGCPHFGLCGGCDWPHMDYGRQLYWKTELVRETLRHLGQTEVDVAPAIPSPVVDGYRNKMEFAFGPPAAVSENNAHEAVPFVLGLRPRAQAAQAVGITSCRLCPGGMLDIQRLVQQWALDTGLPVYDPDSGKGFWRHLVLRQGHPGPDSPASPANQASPDILAVLITSPHPRARGIGRSLAEYLGQHAPQVRSLVHATHKGRSLLALGERIVFKSGPGTTTHHLENLELTVSSRSFFQSNTLGAEQLYAVIRDYAGLSGREALWDLYSGVGGIALSLAPYAARVIGMESVTQAVRDAQANARQNNLAHCRFLAGDVVQSIDQAMGRTVGRTVGRARRPAIQSGSPHILATRPDVIVADPPRAGMQPKVVARLLEIHAPKLILVSCNPATLARDIKLLSPTYRVKRVQPVDMFPHTSHIECVAELAAG